MIINIPTHDQFEKLGLKCLCKSFEMLYSIDVKIDAYTEEITVESGTTVEEYWEHNSITVSTSLIVLFQGIEYLMKAKIAEQSALLLIDNNKNEWPTLPLKSDRHFDELQTISGESLLGVFCAVLPSSFNSSDFVNEYKELRIKRNKLVHSTGVANLEHKYVVEKILNVLSYFYAPTKWIEIFRSMFTSDPTFGYWDWDVESAHFYEVLNFVEKCIAKSKLSKFLPYDINARRYSCPDCSYWLSKHINDTIDPKWSFLSPNNPSSTMIECLICEKKHDVKRIDCTNENCKGNVMYNDELCLTCYYKIS